MQMQIICIKDFQLPTTHNDKFLGRSLRAKGLRLTPQRKVVLHILQQSDEHLDAEGIWRRARGECQDLNLATVYRTLNLLSAVGLIQQSFLGEGQKRGFYELMDKPEHYHFACLNCGKVMELRSDQLKQAQRELEKCNGVQIINVHLKFEGLCPDCNVGTVAND